MLTESQAEYLASITAVLLIAGYVGYVPKRPHRSTLWLRLIHWLYHVAIPVVGIAVLSAEVVTNRFDAVGLWIGWAGFGCAIAGLLNSARDRHFPGPIFPKRRKRPPTHDNQEDEKGE